VGCVSGGVVLCLLLVGFFVWVVWVLFLGLGLWFCFLVWWGGFLFFFFWFVGSTPPLCCFWGFFVLCFCFFFFFFVCWVVVFLGVGGGGVLVFVFFVVGFVGFYFCVANSVYWLRAFAFSPFPGSLEMLATNPRVTPSLLAYGIDADFGALPPFGAEFAQASKNYCNVPRL